MKPSRPGKDHCFALADADLAVALAVLVSERAFESLDDVAHARQDVVPGVGHRVLQVEHHSRGPRVQHLHDQLSVVGRSGHLVALVLAPPGQGDLPAGRGRFGGRQVVWKLAGVRPPQHFLALGGQGLLARSELTMQPLEEIEKPAGQVLLRVQARRRMVHRWIYRDDGLQRPFLAMTLSAEHPVAERPGRGPGVSGRLWGSGARARGARPGA